MLISIDKIELLINEQLLLAVEEILDVNPQLKIVDKNYQLVTNNKETFTLLLDINKGKLNSFSCSCHQNELCEHVVVGTILFRKQIQEPIKVKSTKVTNKLALDNLSDDDLRGFVKGMLKGNKELSIYLQLESLYSIPSKGFEHKYETFIQSYLSFLQTIKNVKSKQNHLTKLLVKLHEYSSLAIVEKDVLEAQAIFKVYFNQLSPILNPFWNEKGTRINFYSNEMMLSFIALFKVPMATQFRLNLLNDLMYGIINPYLILSQWYSELSEYLIYNALVIDNKLPFLEAIKKKMDINANPVAKERLFRLYLRLCNEFNLETNQNNILNYYFNNADNIIDFISNQHDSKSFILETVLKFAETQEFTEMEKLKFLKNSFTSYINIGNMEKALQNAEMYLLSSLDVGFYKDISRQVDEKVFQVFTKTIYQKLLVTNQTKNKLKFEAVLAIHLSQNELFQLILSSKSLTIFIDNLPFLKSNKKATYELAEELCTNYLLNHYGSQSIKYIMEVNYALIKNGLERLSDKLKERLKQKFKGRISLKELI